MASGGGAQTQGLQTIEAGITAVSEHALDQTDIQQEHGNEGANVTTIEDRVTNQGTIRVSEQEGSVSEGSFESAGEEEDESESDGVVELSRRRRGEGSDDDEDDLNDAEGRDEGDEDEGDLLYSDDDEEEKEDETLKSERGNRIRGRRKGRRPGGDNKEGEGTVEEEELALREVPIEGEGKAEENEEGEITDEGGKSESAGTTGDAEAGQKEGEPTEEVEKKPPEPYVVPTSGAFYMHDDRFAEGGGSRPRGGKGGRKLWDSRNEKPWVHDKFEELNLREDDGLPLRSYEEGGERRRGGRGRFGDRGGRGNASLWEAAYMRPARGSGGRARRVEYRGRGSRDAEGDGPHASALNDMGESVSGIDSAGFQNPLPGTGEYLTSRVVQQRRGSYLKAAAGGPAPSASEVQPASETEPPLTIARGGGRGRGGGRQGYLVGGGRGGTGGRISASGVNEGGRGNRGGRSGRGGRGGGALSGGMRRPELLPGPGGGEEDEGRSNAQTSSRDWGAQGKGSLSVSGVTAAPTPGVGLNSAEPQTQQLLLAEGSQGLPAERGVNDSRAPEASRPHSAQPSVYQEGARSIQGTTGQVEQATVGQVAPSQSASEGGQAAPDKVGPSQAAPQQALRQGPVGSAAGGWAMAGSEVQYKTTSPTVGDGGGGYSMGGGYMYSTSGMRVNAPDFSPQGNAAGPVPLQYGGGGQGGSLGLPGVDMGMGPYGSPPPPQYAYNAPEVTWVPVITGGGGPMGSGYGQGYMPMEVGPPAVYYAPPAQQQGFGAMRGEANGTGTPPGGLWKPPPQSPEMSSDQYGQRQGKPRRYSEMSFGH